MSIQRSLELSVSILGVGHRTTLMVSEERDKEVVIAQRKMFNEWQKRNCNRGN
ncbi:MAG: hypothetical protein E7C49_11755 [Clostridium sp.]|nr:hypothetical protein [Clostridium sp.]